MNMVFKSKSILVLGCLFLSCVLNLQIIPERAEVHYINDAVIQNVVLNVRKLSRRGPFVINAKFTLLYEQGNNVTVDILFYEYLHNEYRRTFVEMHFKLCDMIKDDLYLGMALKNAGLTDCPLKPNVYVLSNISIPNTDNFPYLWPFEKAKVTGIYSNSITGIPIANGSVFFTFKQKKNK